MFNLFEEADKRIEQEERSQSYSSKKLYVISLGGSMLWSEENNSFNTTKLAKLADTIASLEREGYDFVIVVGGGAIARKYIAAAKSLGANNFYQDKAAIKATKANASLVIEAIENAFPRVLERIEYAGDVLNKGKIPVYAGLIPGLTTDSVAALIAESLDGVLVNVTKVKGIYSSDPNIDPMAKMHESLSFDRLLRLALRNDQRQPGTNFVLDGFASMIINRSKIKTIVCSGEDPENFARAIRGQEFEGTVIEDL